MDGDLDNVTLADRLIERFVNDKKYGHGNPTTERAYLNSNEDLNATFSCVDVKDKRVMVVGSSGDQLLHSLIHGAREVVLLDLNPLAEVACEYKMAMIKNFSYREFVNLPYKDYLDYKVYGKLSHDLSGEARKFWDYVIMNLSSDYTVREYSYNKEELFERIFFLNNGLFGVNEFEENKLVYDYLKQRLLAKDYKISYKCQDLLDFDSDEMGCFDVVLLSNVLEWTEGWETEFMEMAQKIYNESLTPGGVMEIFYNFRADKLFVNKKLKRIIDYRFEGARYFERKINNKTKIQFLVKPEEFELA